VTVITFGLIEFV